MIMLSSDKLEGFILAFDFSVEQIIESLQGPLPPHPSDMFVWMNMNMKQCKNAHKVQIYSLLYVEDW